MDRRNFISLALIPGLYELSKSIDSLKSKESAYDNNFPMHNIPDRVLPPRPEENSIIAITSPASPTSEWEIRSTMKALRNLGFKIELGKTIKNKINAYKYFSAPDEERAEEFMHFIERDDVSIILCGRGGYGSMRILNLLDYDKIRKNPKVIIGFSDITALLIAIYVRTGLVCFHGPVAVSTFESAMVNFITNLLLKVNYEPISIKSNSIEVLVPGKASGKLIGGNLTMLTSTLGTPYELITDNSILFLEEVSEHPYKIDRMLTQLFLAGKIDKCNGVVVGYIKGANTKRHFFPGGSYTINQVLNDILKKFGLPVIKGIPFGHVKGQIILPIGISAELDAEQKTLVLSESSVI